MRYSLKTIHSKTRRAYDLAAKKYHELFHNEMNEKAYDRKQYSPSAGKPIWRDAMKNVRFYGDRPYVAAVVHGGPGALGAMAPVARGLSSTTGVLEPLQTKASLEGQVKELHDVLKKRGDIPVILIGHSWGAWLSFITTARCPSLTKKLILVASGAFEQKYAVNILGDRLSRLSEKERIEALELMDMMTDPASRDHNKMMSRLGSLFAKADSYDYLPHRDEALEFNYDINKNVWAEAEELRASGALLALGKKIKCPVVAIHGEHDTHLAEGVRKPLSRVLKDFKFILLEKCGHEPWLERYARDRFYDVLKNELK